MAKGSPRSHSIDFDDVGIHMSCCFNTSAIQCVEDIEILHTAVNPDNNKTYHLLTASSWEDAAFKARSLDGYLTTIDDAEETHGCSIRLQALVTKVAICGSG